MTLIPATLTPPVLPRRRQLLFGTAFASVAVAMFLLTLVGMYLSARHAHAGQWLATGPGANVIELTQPVMQLATLLMSAVMMQWAVWAIARDERGQAYLALGITVLMGLAFLNQSSFLWEQAAVKMSQPEGPLFYAVTGGQFAITIAAIGFVILMAFRTLGGQFSSRLPDGVSAAAMFWHVNVALYAVVWYAVYVMK